MNGQSSFNNNQSNNSPINNGSAQNIHYQIVNGNSQVSDVGTATTKHASKISWGVGQKSLKDALAPKPKVQSNFEALFDDDMLNQVNGVVQETEVLDESFLMPNINGDKVANMSNVNNSMNMNGQNVNSQVMQQNGVNMMMQQNGNSMAGQMQGPMQGNMGQVLSSNQMGQRPAIQPVQQPVPKNQVQYGNTTSQNGMQPSAMTQPNMTALKGKPANFTEMLMTPPQEQPQNIVPGEWMNNQPLSSGNLGLNTIDASKSTKDTKENGKFFSENIFNKKKKKENNVKFVAPNTGKRIQLEEPLPQVDMNMLVKSYVGNGFTKLNMSIFSFSAFFLKGAYFIGKKLYFIALASFALELFILTQLKFELAVVFYLALSFILALVANPIYLKLVKAKVKSIRMQKKNRRKNQYELEVLFSKIGGTNNVLAIICFILFWSGTVYLSIYQFPDSLLHTAYDYVVKVEEEKAIPRYEGVIDRMAFNVEDNLNIEIPEEFKKESGRVYRYTYSPDPKRREEARSCSLTISVMSKFKEPEDFMEQYKKYEKIEMKVGKFSKGDLTWYSLFHEKKSFNKTMNATLVNKQVVLLEYNIGKETESGVCEKYYNSIFNSISLKEKKE